MAPTQLKISFDVLPLHFGFPHVCSIHIKLFGVLRCLWWHLVGKREVLNSTLKGNRTYISLLLLMRSLLRHQLLLELTELSLHLGFLDMLLLSSLPLTNLSGLPLRRYLHIWSHQLLGRFEGRWYRL